MAIDNRLVCTVISLVPFEWTEYKPGLIPGLFTVKASDGKIPTCLVVGDAKHNVYIDETRGTLPVRDASDEVARSIVDDFKDSQLGISDGCHPGVFWMPGAWDAGKVLSELKAELLACSLAQRRWFIEITKIADNDWNRYHQHNVISDFQRKAAELLGYTKEEHEWMAPSLIMDARRCPGFNTSVSAGVVICPNCRRILDKEKYNPADYAVAQ